MRKKIDEAEVGTEKAENAENTMTIEETLGQLEEVLTKLESGESTLEESFQLYESGLKLVKSCNNKIDKVEKQIIVLSEDGGAYER